MDFRRLELELIGSFLFCFIQSRLGQTSSCFCGRKWHMTMCRVSWCGVMCRRATRRAVKAAVCFKRLSWRADFNQRDLTAVSLIERGRRGRTSITCPLPSAETKQRRPWCFFKKAQHHYLTGWVEKFTSGQKILLKNLIKYSAVWINELLLKKERKKVTFYDFLWIFWMNFVITWVL